MDGGDLRNVGQVQGRGWREDVGVVLGARLFEAVKRRGGEVFSESLVLMSLSGKLHCGVFGQSHTQRLPMQLLSIQITHR